MGRPKKESRGWPFDRRSTWLDPDTIFTHHLDAAKEATLDHMIQFNRDDLVMIQNQPAFYGLLNADIQEMMTTRLASKEEETIAEPMTLVTVTSMADRAMQVEALRQQIPAEQLINMLLIAVATGKMPDASEELKPAERVKVALSLLEKIIPSAKSIEIDERSGRGDRRRRKLADHTAEELRSLSEEELRDLIQSAREEQT